MKKFEKGQIFDFSDFYLNLGQERAEVGRWR
jgi:hypothetical protein